MTTRPEVVVPDSPEYALTLRYKYAAGFEAYLWFQSDVHWDSPECLRGLLRRHLEEAKDKDALIVDVGDLHDVIASRNDPRGTKDSYRPEHGTGDYLDNVIESSVNWWKPYATQFAYAGYGNHDAKIRKIHETDFTKRWINDLQEHRPGLPKIHRAGYGGWIICRFEHQSGGRAQNCKIKLFHGSGGGGEVTKGTMEAQRMAATIGNADVVITGHVHERWNVELVQECVNEQTGRITQRHRDHFKVGSYKMDYRTDGAPTWHMMRPGGTPKPLGGVFLKFYSVCAPGGGMSVRWRFEKPDVDYSRLQDYLEG